MTHLTLFKGCLPCHREGWDYAKPGTGLNLAGSGYITQVPNVHACGAICKEVEGCYYVSYKQSAQTCYLKDARANKGIEYNDGWQTANVSNCYQSRSGFQCGKVLEVTPTVPTLPYFSTIKLNLEY